jgi:DnaJ-class molecular chaperone
VEYKDYYKTPRTATPADIKKAYRRLARELHPDRNPGDKTAERKFKEANEAHEVLADPKKRQQYDALGSNWDQYGRAGGAGAGAAGSPFGAGASDPFGPGSPFAGYAAQGGGGNVRYEFRSAGSDDFSDFFRTFFAGSDAAAAAGSRSATTTADATGAAAGRTARGRATSGRRAGQPARGSVRTAAQRGRRSLRHAAGRARAGHRPGGRAKRPPR